MNFGLIRFPRRARKATGATLLLETLETRCLLDGAGLAPLAFDDFADTDGTNPVQIAVLSNDTGMSRILDPTSVTLNSAPVVGEAAVNPDGSITYTPVVGFVGTTTFTYTVASTDGLTSNPATVTVIVNRPTANDDFADTDGTNPVIVDVVANDTDPDGAIAPDTVAVTDSPANGQVTVDPITGAVTYTANAGFFGTDIFRYTVQDVHGALSNEATVSIVVNRPTANDDFADTDAATPVIIDVAENDTDPDGAVDPATVTIVSAPGHGTATVAVGTGEVTYTPAAGFSGTDTFGYTIRDVHGATSNIGTVTVTVRPASEVGGSQDDAVDTDAGNPVVIDVLANDSDPSGLDPTTLLITTAPLRGQASIDAATGAITYTPDDGFAGTDTLTYTVMNQNGVTLNQALVSIVVNRPTANDDFTDTDAGNPVTIPVVDNDTDPEGNDRLVLSSVAVVAAASHGTTEVDPATGAITYTPDADFTGTDTFQYTVSDVAGATSNAATVTVVVNRPAAQDDFASTVGTTPAVIDVLENDSDPDGPDKLEADSVAIVDDPTHGSVAVDPTTGSVTYTAEEGFEGTDTFRYTVADEGGAVSNPAMVSVLVSLGQIKGTVFLDTDASGTASSSETGVGGVGLFLDNNGNGLFDEGEPTAQANPEGQYTFVGLTTGSYTVLTVPGPGDTVPTIAAGTAVTISSDSATVTAVDVGQVPVSPVVPVQITTDPFPTGLTSAEATYVHGVYQTLLGREADSAGLGFWTTALQTGVSRQALVDSIWESAEHRGLEVDAYYRSFLGREADAAGRQFWVSVFLSGATEEQVTLAFLSSPAFAALHSEEGGLARALYRAVLGREGDAAGLSAANAFLASNPAGTAGLAQALLSSTEAAVRVLEGYFSAFLHRPAGQSAAFAEQIGLQFLPGSPLNAQLLGEAILASDEVFAAAAAHVNPS